jgi:hypothetical protein
VRPSFFALFKRGKYFHPAPLPSATEKLVRVRGNTRETERFAAAAIAFAWEHHPPLKRHFWKTVCHFPGDPPLSPAAEILVEPERWADLLIINRVGNERFVYVVECKIGAGLDKYQDPSRRAFGQLGGYGRMLTASDSRPGTHFRFIVFGFPDALNLATPPWTLPLSVQQRTWDEFAADFPKTPLARDLALSLGRLGVGAFPASETKSMKVDTKRSDLGNAVRTIAEVQRRLDWPGGRGCTANFYQEETTWYLGLDLKRAPKAANSATLAKLAKPPGRALAWIGYQGEDDERAQLAFYVYCGDADTQKKVAALLSQKLKGFQIDPADPDKKYFCVIVTARAHKLPNDVAWFCSVFIALGLTLKS